MTKPLIGQEIARQIGDAVPQSVVDSGQSWVLVQPESVLKVARFLKTAPGMEFDYLTCLTGTDYLDYIEVVYILTSMKHNHSVVLKARCNREKPEVPSVVELWRGADYQEREVYDLLGVKFPGHPNMRRLFLWEGFKGHPLRRDYL
jgi:NADH-quinone oxidoreductase subunit C